jgi:hypothetical protein
MDYSRYPRCWQAISRFVRFYRAGGCCEYCGAAQGQPHPITGARVVLTVHHIGIDKPDGTPGDPHDKRDCRLKNLVALCQRCHLIADLPIHMQHAAETRRLRRIEAGQLELWRD